MSNHHVMASDGVSQAVVSVIAARRSRVAYQGIACTVAMGMECATTFSAFASARTVGMASGVSIVVASSSVGSMVRVCLQCGIRKPACKNDGGASDGVVKPRKAK